MKKINKIIVTAGGTREWIDPVRYISNASTGKMGYCIAKEFLQTDKEIIYIRGNVSDSYKSVEKAKNIAVETTEDLLENILKEFTNGTLLIMAAAPADFKPVEKSEIKIKKQNSQEFILVLKSNPDILKTLNEKIQENHWENCVLVGFAAETHDLEKNAREKLKQKGLKFIIANPITSNSGFGETKSSIKIFSQNGLEYQVFNSPKEIIAQEIVKFLEKKLED